MNGSMFIGTWWALVPPLLAILLAFVTKEVYSSLFIGSAVGVLLYTGFHPWDAFTSFFEILRNSMNINMENGRGRRSKRSGVRFWQRWGLVF